MKGRLEASFVVRPTWCFRIWPTVIHNSYYTDGWREIMVSWLGILITAYTRRSTR